MLGISTIRPREDLIVLAVLRVFRRDPREFLCELVGRSRGAFNACFVNCVEV